MSKPETELPKYLLAVGLTSLAVFILIAFLVSTGKTLYLDSSILTAIRQLSSQVPDKLFVFITSLGGVYAGVSFAVVTSVYFYFRHNLRAAQTVMISVLGSSLACYLLKLVFQRTRPNLWETLVFEDSFAFPSGHAAASSALAFSLIVVFWHSKYKLLVLVTGLIYVALIGLSRMYLGVHYFSDVLAGWMLSLFIVTLTNVLIKKRLKAN